MKARLVILSDLWGISETNWESWYIDKLSSKFDIVYYDSCILGNISKINYNQKDLHQQFINGGIDNAVNKLLQLETEQINVLTFSIGGTIAWKAGLKGLKIENLISLSATRLRYENQKPNCNIQLIYGDEDIYMPSMNWFNQMNIIPRIIKHQSHDFYRNILDEELIHKEISFF